MNYDLIKKRDYFAAVALQAMLTDPKIRDENSENMPDVTEACVAWADQLIASLFYVEEKVYK